MVLIPQTGSATRVTYTAKQAWSAAGICLALAAVALCFIFAPEATGAYRVWLDSTAYNHCFLVVPVALYLAWTKRDVLDRLVPKPQLPILAVLVPLSLLWLVAALMSVLELQQFIVMAMFQCIAFAILGRATYWALAMPLLYLFFLVPTGYFLVPSLQDFTAWFAVAALKLAGIPVFSDGTFINVPSGTFVVAEACAGLRFLIASIAFGVFFAAITYRSLTRRLLFVGMSIVMPIIANGIRAFGIIAIAEWMGSATAVETDHILYGWLFFSLVTFLLIAIGMAWADGGPAEPQTRHADYVPTTVARPYGIALVAFLGLVLAGSGPSYAQLRDWRSQALGLAAASPPPLAGPWTPVDGPGLAWKPKIEQPDREFLASFSDGSHTVARYIALYKVDGFHNNLVRGTNDVADGGPWRMVRTKRTHAMVDGHDATVATTVLASVGHRLYVWHFYIVDGRVVASPFEAKLAQLRGLLGFEHTVASFVALATASSEPDRTLQQFLTGLGPLGPYLASVSPKS